MEPKICSLTSVISIYYNLHLEFIYSTYLTDTDKRSDFKIKNGFILHNTTFHTSKINTKIDLRQQRKDCLLPIACFYHVYSYSYFHEANYVSMTVYAWNLTAKVLIKIK